MAQGTWALLLSVAAGKHGQDAGDNWQYSTGHREGSGILVPVIKLEAGHGNAVGEREVNCVQLRGEIAEILPSYCGFGGWKGLSTASTCSLDKCPPTLEPKAPWFPRTSYPEGCPAH